VLGNMLFFLYTITNVLIGAIGLPQPKYKKKKEGRKKEKKKKKKKKNKSKPYIFLSHNCCPSNYKKKV